MLHLFCFKTTKPLKPIPGVCTYYNTCQHLHLYFKSNIRPLNLIWWKLECRPVIFFLQQDIKIYPQLYQVFYLLLHLSRPGNMLKRLPATFDWFYGLLKECIKITGIGTWNKPKIHPYYHQVFAPTITPAYTWILVWNM